MADKIAIGADHGGFGLKEKISKILDDLGYKSVDVGTFGEDPCDYPMFGYEAAKMVSLRKAKTAIIVCKSGIGMSIIANKLPGIRAGLCHTTKQVSSAREHNDANVLVLSANETSPRQVRGLVKTWLTTKALKGRHARRVKQIKDIEKKVFKKLK